MPLLMHLAPKSYNTLWNSAGRLEEQKGVDVLLEALPQILGGSSRAQVVVLGTGKKALEQQVAQMESRFPSSAKGVVEFNGARRLPCTMYLVWILPNDTWTCSNRCTDRLQCKQC